MKKKFICSLIVVIINLLGQSSQGSFKIQEEQRIKNSSKEASNDIIEMIEKVNYSILFGDLEKIVSFGGRDSVKGNTTRVQ